jgi:hypothetical protein
VKTLSPPLPHLAAWSLHGWAEFKTLLRHDSLFPLEGEMLTLIVSTAHFVTLSCDSPCSKCAHTRWKVFETWAPDLAGLCLRAAQGQGWVEGSEYQRPVQGFTLLPFSCPWTPSRIPNSISHLTPLAPFSYTSVLPLLCLWWPWQVWGVWWAVLWISHGEDLLRVFLWLDWDLGLLEGKPQK